MTEDRVAEDHVVEDCVAEDLYGRGVRMRLGHRAAPGESSAYGSGHQAFCHKQFLCVDRGIQVKIVLQVWSQC